MMTFTSEMDAVLLELVSQYRYGKWGIRWKSLIQDPKWRWGGTHYQVRDHYKRHLKLRASAAAASRRTQQRLRPVKPVSHMVAPVPPIMNYCPNCGHNLGLMQQAVQAMATIDDYTNGKAR